MSVASATVLRVLPNSVEDNPSDLLTTAEVAAIGGVSRTTVHRWAKAGVLPTAFRIPSGHRRFRRADVTALLATEAEDVAS